MFRFRPAATATLAASLALGGAHGSLKGGVPSFEKHLEEHGLSYHGDELQERKKLFEQVVEKVEKQNSGKGLWKAAVNKFATLTEKEMGKHYGYMKTTEKKRASGRQAPRSGDAPSSFDWRDAHPKAVTPVKNQGSCGSCWAFAATAAMETVIAMDTGMLFEMSPQQLVSCMPNVDECGGSGGCMGATAQLAFDYTARHGCTSVWKWPYESGTGGNGECQEDNWRMHPIASISGFVQLPQNDAASLLSAVLVSPVAVSVAASTWGLYGSGIYDGCRGPNVVINHAVVCVGYGEEHGVHYWTIRNSWGAGWGELGHIRLQRFPEGEACHTDNEPLDGYSCKSNPPTEIRVCGMCGVLSDSSYPTGGLLGPPQGPPDDPAINGSSIQRLFETPGRVPLPARSSTTPVLAAAAGAIATALVGLVIRARRSSADAAAVPLCSDDEAAELDPVAA